MKDMSVEDNTVTELTVTEVTMRDTGFTKVTQKVKEEIPVFFLMLSRESRQSRSIQCFQRYIRLKRKRSDYCGLRVEMRGKQELSMIR